MTSLTVDKPRIKGLSVKEAKVALEHRNPKVSSKDIQEMARLIAIVSDALLKLPKDYLSGLVSDRAEVRRLIIEAAEKKRPKDEASSGPGDVIEKSRGAGLGKRLSPEEGRDALKRYAVTRPIESWAGPVAGASDVEKKLGIPRSTLSSWQKSGAIIGLLRGERKLSYPLEQFVDSRPLKGISDVLRMAPDARSAWLWLRQRHGALDGATPLSSLKANQRERVITVAKRDFV